MRHIHLVRLVLLVLAAGCMDSPGDAEAGQVIWPDRHIYVGQDGSFSPANETVHVGQTLIWHLATSTDAVVPANTAAYPAICDVSNRRPWTGTANDLTGPMPRTASGTFVASPDDVGFEHSRSAVCVDGARGIAYDDTETGPWLCKTGPYQSTLDTVIAYPGVTGVFVRLKWKDLNPAWGVYDWTILDRELDKIVAHGKLFSLSIKAGVAGTPDWIFSTERCTTRDCDGNGAPRPVPGPARSDGGGKVRRLYLDWNEDPGTQAKWASFGSPLDPQYRLRYKEMISAVAARIKERADWYRALAYIKPSGANHHSAENRLPNGCKGTTSCNARYWAEDGYTPQGLYSFYTDLLGHFATQFPGKTMSYQLIHDGFPKVTDVPAPGIIACWGTDRPLFDIACPNSVLYGSPMRPASQYPMPSGVEQTEQVLLTIRSRYPFDMAIQHNGLRPVPAGPCPGSDLCPNFWAYRAGHLPLPGYTFGQITGYQHGTGYVNTAEQLAQAYGNLYDNSDGVFVEAFEPALWRASPPHAGSHSRAEGLIQRWTNLLHDRRRTTYPSSISSFPDPTPTEHAVTFSAVGSYPYVHASRCGEAADTSGTITVIP